MYSECVCVWDERRVECCGQPISDVYHDVDYVSLTAPFQDQICPNQLQRLRHITDTVAVNMHSRYGELSNYMAMANQAQSACRSGALVGNYFGLS